MNYENTCLMGKFTRGVSKMERSYDESWLRNLQAIILSHYQSNLARCLPTVDTHVLGF